MDRKIEIESNSINPEADRYIQHLVPGIKSFSKYMGFAVSLIGLLVIFSWLVGIEQLNNVFAGLSAMKANAAIAFVTAGLSLWLRGGTSPKRQTTVQVLGVITGLIGLLTLGEYVLGRNFGMDELIFKDLASSGVLHPGRMSFMSALNFTMMGMALLLLDSHNERRYNLAQSLTLVAGIIAYVALAGYLFDVDSLYRVGATAPMAFHTALNFILLFVGIVCAQPEGGWVGNLIADTLGADLLRRLLPVAFVAPILLGWLRLQGQLAGYYETAFGTALLAVAITLFLSVIIWFNAKGLTRVDLDRRQMEQNLRESEEKYRALFNSIDEGFCIIEKVESKAGEPLDFRYVVANPAFATQAGIGDVVGKTIRQAFPGEPDEWFETYDNILRTGEALRFERGLVTQGRVLELYAFRIEDETHRRVAVIFKDITARKKAENHLALLVDISELTRKFEDANGLLFAVSEAIGEHLQVRRCLFNETDLENDRETVHRDYTNGVESVAGVHKLSDYSSVTSAEMEAGKTVVNFDSKIDARTAGDYEMAYARNGERAYVAVPLMRENCWVATLWVSDDMPRQWSNEEISLLETVAERTWTATEKLRIDTALRASEERYRNLFDLVPVAVYTCDAKGLIQEFNHRAVELWGREPLKNDPNEKFCGSFKIFYPDGRFMPHEECPMARMMGGETLEPHELEILVERPDGVRKNVLAHPLALKNERAEIVGAINCLYDITERKQAEEALQFARDQAEQTADRIARLQRVTAALSEALTPLQVAKIVVDQGAPALGAVSGTVMLLAEDSQNLEIVYSASPQPVIQPYQRFSVSVSVPAADAARSGEPVWIESRQQYLEHYPHLADQINLWDHQAALAIPMFDKGRILGVLALSFDNILPYSPKDQDYVLTLARQGAQALERARLYEAEQQARQVATEFAQQQEALYKLTDQLQRTNSLEDVFNAALDAIFGALQCDRASILLFDDSDLMHFVAWRGLSDNYRKSTDGHSPWEPDEKNSEPISINDVATGEISDSLKTVIQAEGIGSLAFIPLVSDGKLIGKFMTYYNTPHVFSEGELDMSLTIARQLAFGIERKRAEGSLRESKERYRNLFDLVPVGVYVCNAEGLIQEFNHRAVELWGREPLKNDPKEKFCGSFKMFHQDGRFMPHDTCPMARILGGETLEPHELEILVERPDGTRHNIVAHPLPLKDESGEITGAINSFYDITERKQVEEALRESEERFRAILRQATAGIVRKNAEGKLMFVNEAFCNMLGYTESELLGKTIWQLTHNDDVEENKRLFDRTMIEGIPFKLEKRLMRQDGSTLWVDVSVSPIVDATGKPQSAVAVEVDITGRKQAEEALRDLNIQLESRVQNRTVKLQEANQSLLNEIAERQKAEEALHESGKRLQILSQRLVEVQEEERRAIARELHDSVGQSLSALNINLVILDNQISNSANEQIRTRLNDSMQLTAETISLVRDVMSNLRPSVLDDYGLEAALQSYLDQFKSRYAIKVMFEKPDQPLRRLGSSIEMTFLRIAQEALLNIARHAHADQVNLSLEPNGNIVRLIVQDNGSGIESWPDANRPGSHGLTIMRERADAVGGNLRVLSVPGKGTKVEVSIPIENGGPLKIQEERRE